MNAASQELFEPGAYHDSTGVGFFSLHAKDNGRFLSDYYQLTQLPQVYGYIDANRDTYIGQADLRVPQRRIINIQSLGLCFVDLDTYKLLGLADKGPGAITDLFLLYCSQSDIPEPSIVIFSGRGLQAKWIFNKPINPNMLTIWNDIQISLVNRLSDFGADPAARDAARVLRLVNTRNTKSGEIVKITYALQPLKMYDFSYLTDLFYIPPARKKLPARQKKPSNILTFFSNRKLSWDRLCDIRKLYELRGGVPVGERMINLFWRLNFLLMSRITSSRMYLEAQAIAKEIDKSWSYHESELGTLYRKAQIYEAGERVEFMGRAYKPLYTPRNSTLLSLFHISPDEEKRLKTIISKNESYRRKKAKRREKGVISREEYLKNIKENSKRYRYLLTL